MRRVLCVLAALASPGVAFAADNPTMMTIMLGMNDGRYQRAIPLERAVVAKRRDIAQPRAHTFQVVPGT
jgi:hypothetical protein